MPITTTFSLFKLFQRFGISAIGHFGQFFLVFDPVKDSSAQSNTKHPSRFNRFCLFPLSILLYIYLDTIYQIWDNGFVYLPDSMPTLFTHRIYPKILWPITDVMMIVGLWMPTMTFVCLLFDRMDKHQKLFMFMDDKKPVDAANAPIITQNGKGKIENQ